MTVKYYGASTSYRKILVYYYVMASFRRKTDLIVRSMETFQCLRLIRLLITVPWEQTFITNTFKDKAKITIFWSVKVRVIFTFYFTLDFGHWVVSLLRTWSNSANNCKTNPANKGIRKLFANCSWATRAFKSDLWLKRSASLVVNILRVESLP